MRPSFIVAVPAIALALSACASDAPYESRLLVKLAQPSTDGASIERRAAAVARRPVRYLAATSDQWHALAVQCDSASACDAAVERLRADPAYQAVQIDARRRAATP